MPIFGLVWVASWVGCFFSSHQDLLRAPDYVTCVSTPAQSDSHLCGQRSFPLSRLELPIRPQAKEIQLATQSTVATTADVATDALTSSSSHNLFETLKSFFVGHPTVTPASLGFRLTSPVVVVAQLKRPDREEQKDSGSTTLGFAQCSSTSKNASTIARSGIFQIRVKDFVVSETFDRKQATQIAQRLERFLQNSNLNPDQLQPALVDGVAAGKGGDRLLFTVDKEVAQIWDCNPEYLAIRWVNNLRIALAASPLSLTAAQEKMHRLQETGERIEGLASWYGPYFNGRQTATGEIFDQDELTAAHPSLPFDTYLKVTNLNNGKSVIVRVNDRGPYFENRTLDLSREAARLLGSESVGVVPIEATIMYPASPNKQGDVIAKL